ncbi:SIR2 family protein [Micrococcus antarcticus]
MLPEFDDSRLQAIRRAALNGEYHLLLGAGASRDSISERGAKLPGSVELSHEISSAFDVFLEEGDFLWRVYDRAVQKAGIEKVYSWLKSKFWNVTPPYWMEYYARFPWNSVWTLNIDDSFESAYKDAAGPSSRTLRVLNWDDEYSRSKNLDVIHLHGLVDNEKTRELVFSLSEYAGSAVVRAAWPLNFRDSYGNSPFVILGARLRDEPDIEAVIARRNPANDAPSFYVSRTISEGMRDDLERWGLIPIEMTAEDFVMQWSELTKLDLERPVDNEFEVGLRVGQQFIELNSYKKMGKQKDHDFYGGDEPSWSDVLQELPAELEWVTDAKSKCGDLGTRLRTASVIAYSGRRLSGRSTGLLQIAYYLHKTAWRVFYFRSEERIDIEAIISYAGNGREVALMFDGIADIVDDVNELITRARAADLKIVCIAVEDTKRVASILGRVEPAYLAYNRVHAIRSRLSGSDSTQIIKKLDSYGRLGILEGQTPATQNKHFRGKELFDAMSRVENAPGFGRRVGELLTGIVSNATLEIVLIASYASYVDRKLIIVDAARMVSMDTDDLIALVENDEHLGSLLTTDGLQLRTRHRWMALDHVLARLGTPNALAAISRGIRRVGPRLNQSSYRERNATTMLVGSMMQHKNLDNYFHSDDLDEWYSGLIDVFGQWSGHYWEQRAIQARRASNVDVGLLAKAESFAMRAKEFLPDTYRYTTLGTVLMEKAARADVDVHVYFERAESAFLTAAERDRDLSSSFVTWNAYLQFALYVLERLKKSIIDESSAEGVHDLYEKVKVAWMHRYNMVRLIAESNDDTSESLERLRSKFDSIVY